MRSLVPTVLIVVGIGMMSVFWLTGAITMFTMALFADFVGIPSLFNGPLAGQSARVGAQDRAIFSNCDSGACIKEKDSTEAQVRSAALERPGGASIGGPQYHAAVSLDWCGEAICDRCAVIGVSAGDTAEQTHSGGIGAPGNAPVVGTHDQVGVIDHGAVIGASTRNRCERVLAAGLVHQYPSGSAVVSPEDHTMLSLCPAHGCTFSGIAARDTVEEGGHSCGLSNPSGAPVVGAQDLAIVRRATHGRARFGVGTENTVQSFVDALVSNCPVSATIDGAQNQVISREPTYDSADSCSCAGNSGQRVSCSA